MARLTKKEAAALKALQEKADAPDTAPSSRALNISIDLGDEAQVERARKLGLLDGLDDDENGEEEEEEEGEQTPRRRGYFKDGDK